MPARKRRASRTWGGVAAEGRGLASAAAWSVEVVSRMAAVSREVDAGWHTCQTATSRDNISAISQVCNERRPVLWHAGIARVGTRKIAKDEEKIPCQARLPEAAGWPL